MRPFYLNRIEDVSGVSGTGIVAIGVEFPDKRVVMQWISIPKTMTIFGSIAEVQQVHCHGGASRVHWGLPNDTTEQWKW